MPLKWLFYHGKYKGSNRHKDIQKYKRLHSNRTYIRVKKLRKVAGKLLKTVKPPPLINLGSHT